MRIEAAVTPHVCEVQRMHLLHLARLFLAVFSKNTCGSGSGLTKFWIIQHVCTTGMKFRKARKVVDFGVNNNPLRSVSIRQVPKE